MASLGRVLIADDEKSLLMVYAGFLREEGYECDSAYDTETIIEMMSYTKYDLLITDSNMHGNSEQVLINNLSEIAKDIQVLMVNGDPSNIYIIHSIKQRENSFLLKPFKLKELLQRVRGFIK